MRRMRMFEDRRILIGESESGSPIWFDVSPADLISSMLAGRPSNGGGRVMARTVRDLIRQLEMFDPDVEVLAEERHEPSRPYPFMSDC
jgi:hypothetical protein